MINWPGIMTVLEINHCNSKGNILYQEKNLKNLLHYEGEEFLLRAAFTGGQVSTVIPDNYYLGLDDRSTVLAGDTLDDLVAEPTSGGYQRQPVSSSSDFSVNFEEDHFVARSPIIAFHATSADWGPVSKLFLSTSADSSGLLLSTVTLSSFITVEVGDSVTMRIGMQLRAC